MFLGFGSSADGFERLNTHGCRLRSMTSSVDRAAEGRHDT